MSKKIDRLIEKYWDAETSLEEEKLIKDYFAQDQVAAEHLELAPLFGHFNSLAQQVSSKDLPELLEFEDEIAKVRTLSLTKWIGRVAAVITIVGASMILFQNDEVADATTVSYAGKYTQINDANDPKAKAEAMEITREALAFLSKNLNKSSNTIKTHVKSVEKAKIFKDSTF